MTEQSIFTAALEQAPDCREVFLDAACGGDVALRQRVAVLLAAHGRHHELLDGESLVAAPHQPLCEQPGMQIGPYKLVEQIGEGGMGAVWMAQQTEPVKRLVAVKLIKAGMDSRQVIARFDAERQALALMDHAHIARVLDAGTTSGGRPYFVMDLVRGVPITRYCDEQRLAPRQRLELFIPVCQAIQHAHTKGIIHRDLKPSNILVALYDGVPAPIVIDFGVARATGSPLTEKTVCTQYGQIIGTFEYMSPEQAQFNQLDIDTRSDIYSLGVLLYELLTGTTPLEQSRLRTVAFDETLRIIREEEPPKPSTRLSTADALPAIAASRSVEPARLNKLVRGELDWIVMKALEKNRDLRYETAHEFARDIERYLRDEPVLACPPSAAYKLRKFARTHRQLLAAAAAFALLLTAGCVVSTWQAIRATRAEQRATDERNRVVAEQRRGDQEAAIAKAVDEFLERDLLGQADIGNQAAGQVRNPKITVRELLDRAARGIDARFKGQERTEAAIRLTLGRAYRTLGEFDAAQKHLERSFALRKEKLGLHDASTLQSLEALALLAWSRGRHDDAETLFAQTLDIRRQTLGADHLNTLGSMNNLANLWWQHGRYAEAEDFYQRVHRARRAKLGGNHPDTLTSLGNLALLYAGQGRFAEAEPMFQEAIDGYRSTLGVDHPETFRTLANMASLYSNWGRYDEAERRYRELLAEGRRIKLDDDSPEMLRYTGALGAVLLARKQYADAEPLFRQVLDGRRARLDPDHPDTLTTMNDLAVVCMETRRYDEAEPLFRDALKASRTRAGPGHPLTLKITNCLASLCALRRQFDEAERLFGEVLESRRATLSKDHPETLISVHNLGACYRLSGKYDRAEPLLIEAVEGARTRLGANHPYTRKYIGSLVQLFEAWDKQSEADKWREQLTAPDGNQESKDTTADR
jgi:non-specific serine/threonine protein kinase/serine/threonine-protein kinase